MNFLTSRGSSHMILNSIFCRDEFPKVPKNANDDRLTKLTFFGVVRDKWCRWKISRQYLVGLCAARGRAIGSLVPQTQSQTRYLVSISSFYLGRGSGGGWWWCTGSPQMISSTILFVDELPFLQKFPPPRFWTLYFVVTISITSQQNVCEEKKLSSSNFLFLVRKYW